MKTWYSVCAIVLFFYIVTTNAQIAYEEDLYTITNEILRLIDYPGNAMKDLQRHRNRTDDEMAEELMFVCNALAGNGEMFGARVNAFGYIGYFPSTNAIPFLQESFKSEENACGSAALGSYIIMMNYSEVCFASVDAFLDENSYSGHRMRVYSQLSTLLDYGNPDDSVRIRIISFIRLRAGKGDIYGTWLDDILCRHLDGYATSDERRQNLNKLLDNPMVYESTIERARSRLLDMDRPSEPPKSELETVEPEPSHENTDAVEMEERPVSALEANPASEMSPSRHPSPEEKPTPRRFWIPVLMAAALLGLFLSMLLRRFHKANHRKNDHEK